MAETSDSPIEQITVEGCIPYIIGPYFPNVVVSLRHLDSGQYVVIEGPNGTPANFLPSKIDSVCEALQYLKRTIANQSPR